MRFENQTSKGFYPNCGYGQNKKSLTEPRSFYKARTILSVSILMNMTKEQKTQIMRFENSFTFL